MPKRMGAVQMLVMAKSGARLDDIRVSAAVLRGGTIRRKKVDAQPRTNNFLLKMEVGTHAVFVSSPGYYEAARRLTFLPTGDPPLVRIVLESKHSATFPSFDELDNRLKRLLRRSTRAGTNAAASNLLVGLSQNKKAGMFNVLAKMGAVDVDQPGAGTVLDHVDQVYEFYQDRIYIRLRRGSDLLDRIEAAIARGDQRFSVAESALHEGFQDASFKTHEPTGTGNLQLSFNTRTRDRHKIDADIDIYTDVLRHLFGEVFRNHLTGMKTDPFHVYQVLTHNDIQPPYRLLAADEEVTAAPAPAVA